MTELRETRMGQTLLPELVRQLERERLADLHLRAGVPQPQDPKDEAK